ncbi:MAG: sigma-70 family RNA polymerase sigma factor [Acidobacteria bacterium]|nr:sigma-70 family RNA polymerase sigma factor [Acidobacteriota bacterium]
MIEAPEALARAEEVTAAGEVTRLLRAWQGGDADAAERLLPLVVGELRKIAASCLVGERPGHTLQPTALVNEAYLRLVRQTCDWQTRSHFFAVAARSIRRVLVDHARRIHAAKRGQALRVTFDEGLEVSLPRPEALVALDDALALLAGVDPIKARVVEYRFFAGLTGEEIAAVENLSPATVQRHWQMARAWLYRELSTGADA